VGPEQNPDSDNQELGPAARAFEIALGFHAADKPFYGWPRRPKMSRLSGPPADPIHVPPNSASEGDKRYNDPQPGKFATPGGRRGLRKGGRDEAAEAD
jgi:hypothetical protein